MHAFFIFFEGAPAAPNVSLHLVDVSTLRLRWEPPFTWRGFEILRYTVNMENRSSGYVLPPVTLSPSETAHTLRASAPLQSCAELRFSVTAHTAAGVGTPAVVTGGFPIGEEWCGQACRILITIPLKYSQYTIKDSLLVIIDFVRDHGCTLCTQPILTAQAADSHSSWDRIVPDLRITVVSGNSFAFSKLSLTQ